MKFFCLILRGCSTNTSITISLSQRIILCENDLHSQVVRARELNFFKKIHLWDVMCCVS